MEEAGSACQWASLTQSESLQPPPIPSAPSVSLILTCFFFPSQTSSLKARTILVLNKHERMCLIVVFVWNISL